MKENYNGKNLIVLIGAARSGTKMLRDIISTHSKIEKIPFDINYIWKYGNEHITHDALDISHVSDKSSSFIKNYMFKKGKANQLLIEKTVSNTLRVNYVYQNFPDAKFIHLIRDGRDVIESVNRQWGVAPSNDYILKKLKTFPFSKVVSYGTSYFLDLIKINIFGKPSDKYVWGVKHQNYLEDLSNKSTLEFCAIQWVECIKKAQSQLENIPNENVLEIKYENFVHDAKTHLIKIQDFIGTTRDIDNSKVKSINSKNVGKGFKTLNSSQQEKILNIIKPTLKKLKYI